MLPAVAPEPTTIRSNLRFIARRVPSFCVSLQTSAAARSGYYLVGVNYTASLCVALVVLTGCRRDPSRDVRPVSAAPADITDISEEVIPLDQVSKSQAAAVAQRIATTEITVTYSRPVARGRQLFGALVPYGQVWTPGADKATTLGISRNIEVNGRPLPKGSYSMWTIPRPDQWTVIFNRKADAYHTDYPGDKQDALRLQVTPRNVPHIETLTFSFPMVEGKEAVLEFAWGELAVPLSIRVP